MPQDMVFSLAAYASVLIPIIETGIRVSTNFGVDRGSKVVGGLKLGHPLPLVEGWGEACGQNRSAGRSNRRG